MWNVADDTAKPKEFQDYGDGDGYIRQVSFSPDGSRFASGEFGLITANSENLVSARAQKIKKPGHSKKEMASIKGKGKADASCS